MTWRMCFFAFILVVAQAFAFAQDATAQESTGASKPSSASAGRSVRPSIESLTASPTMLNQEQITDLIQKVADNDIENNKKQRNYTYIRREEEHKLNSKGEVQSTESRTSEVMMLYGSQVSRLIAKNDKPLSPKDNDKEDQRIQKIIEKRRNETEEQRKKRLQAEEKEREESRQWVREISEAFNFRLAGIENMQGRKSYVIDAEPRPGFRPHLKDAKYLPKFRFTVWVDKAEMQWVKLDAECIDNISFGLLVARLHKGAHIMVEQTRVNNEVWLPRHEAVKLEVRVALLKNFNMEEDTTYRDYKKFRIDTRIVGMGEVQQ